MPNNFRQIGDQTLVGRDDVQDAIQPEHEHRRCE
jgi:hypothetical protein